MKVLGAALLISFTTVSFAQDDPWSQDSGLLDPRGTWTCVFFGNPAIGDERALLSFAPDQSTLMAIPEEDSLRPWLPLSRWQLEDETFTFSDSRNGRAFEANLRRTTLGGDWRATNLRGGWWCTATGDGIELGIFADPNDRTRETLVPLIPMVMARPAFPRQAIRGAVEGRVVICFVVDPTGNVRDPEFVELTEEIFRAASLDSLMSSSYRPWLESGDEKPRPACRSFLYLLDKTF